MTQTKTSDDCKQLSGSVIAMNPSRNGNKGVIYSYNLDSYKELTRQAWLAQLIGQIRATEDPSCVTPERIIFITDATFSKTERFIAKYGHYGTPMAA